MESIDIETVRPYVNGIAHTLKLAQFHASDKNIERAAAEIRNAQMELEALLEKLNKPYRDRGEEPPKDPFRDR